MGKITWHSEVRKLSNLKPFKGNPRQATEKQEKDLKNSLNKFNLAAPIVINTNNTIIGGHFRYRILSKNGGKNKDIAVRVPNRKLTKKEIKELNLRLNKNLGEWDFDLLADNFEIDLLEDVGFDLDELGFNKQEVVEDEYVEENIEQKTKIGDLYKLGEHQLLCGDATKQEDVGRLTNGEKANMVFTDPPYDLEKEKLKLTFDNCKEYSDLMFWMGVDKQVSFLSQDKSFTHFFVQDFINPTLISNKQPMSQHTLIAKFGNRKINNLKDGFSTIIKIRTTRIARNEVRHEKLLELSRQFIIHYSKHNDLILDVFGGSGSTLIATEQLNRKCYMMEIDPHYCDVIVDRWEQFTGEKVEKL